MVRAQAICIYCSGTFDPTRGEGDHIIPSSLGEFENDVRFRGACPRCNGIVGQAEQQLVQCGREAFLRQIVKPKSRRAEKRGPGQMRGAMKAPAPQFTIDLGDHLALVEPSPDDPRDVYPVDQVIVADEAGHTEPVRLFPGMRLEQLRSRLSRMSIGEAKTARLRCDDDHYDEYVQLLKSLWPKSDYEPGPITEAGVYKVPGRAKFVVNVHYFRALAKIAFHYYLAHSNRGHRGDEPCFEGIRNFIMDGGNSDEFFNQAVGARFAMPFGELPQGGVVTPTQWCHVLAASEKNGQADAYVQLFVGPGCVPKPYGVRLGKWDNPIVAPKAVWAHVYLYEPERTDNFAGQVVEASLTRLR
jgi:hypothetical protein